MSGWMPSDRSVLAPAGRRLLRSVVAGGAVALSVVLPATVAAAGGEGSTNLIC
jgi:hypothetical protein